MLVRIVDKARKPQGSRCACDAVKGIGLPGDPKRKEARQRITGNATPNRWLRKRRLHLGDYLIQQLIKKIGSLAAERLGIAYGPVACPGAQLAIPIEPANGDEGEWRTVELSATLINLAAVAHDHGKVDDRRAFRMIRINGYLLLMRFHDGLLSVL